MHRDGLKMSGIAASWLTAKVIESKSAGDFAFEGGISNAMRSRRLALSGLADAVTTIETALPNPARRAVSSIFRLNAREDVIAIANIAAPHHLACRRVRGGIATGGRGAARLSATGGEFPRAGVQGAREGHAAASCCASGLYVAMKRRTLASVSGQIRRPSSRFLTNDLSFMASSPNCQMEMP